MGRGEAEGKLCDACAVGVDPSQVAVHPDGAWSYLEDGEEGKEGGEVEEEVEERVEVKVIG